MSEQVKQGMEEVPLETCVLPENFADTGRCFNGMFRTRNLVEAVIITAPVAYFTSHLDLPMQQLIVAVVIGAGSVFLACVNGINGDSVTEFIYHLILYDKRKRVAKYNPRVKQEATPGYLTKEAYELPRDKILRVINEAKSRTTETEEAVSSEIYDPLYKEFFEDDLGYLATPDDLKSSSERRKEHKERKRKEKQAKKERARAEKEARKKAKKEGKCNVSEK